MDKKLAWIRSALAGAALALPGLTGALDIEVVNRTTLAGPMDGNGNVERIATVTADGRYTLLSSSANNLVAGDTNREPDLFLHDATTATVERVSVGNGGVQAEGHVGTIGAVSDDGRYVVFDSDAENLVATPTHGYRQIYLRDRIAGTTTLLSRLGSGAAAAAHSQNARISADGRYVVFDTYSAFDTDDSNADGDVYRLDRQTGAFMLISISADGRIGNGRSYEPQISADGSSVAFYTWATNLVAGDMNTAWDLLLRKPAAGTTERVSRKADGSQLTSYPNLAHGNALSADGRYVAFNAYEALVTDDTNGSDDGYRYDSQAGSIERVTLGAGGAQIDAHTAMSALSRDGQRLLMHSYGGGIVAGQAQANYRVFLRDLSSGENTHMRFRPGAELQGDDVYGGLMSDDGSVVVATSGTNGFVADDSNGLADAYRQADPDQLPLRLSAPSAEVSLAAANRNSGIWGYAASSDLRYVTFDSEASNLVVGDTNNTSDIFVRDRLLGTTERVSVHSSGTQGFCASNHADISADGRYVVFQSCWPHTSFPVPFRMEIYRHDRLTHTTEAVSVTPQQTQSDSFSLYPSISDDGNHVAFASCASDLVAGDVNGLCDVFVRDMQAGVTTLVSRSADPTGANFESFTARIAGDGSAVAFMSMATNLVASDSNGEMDIFVFDRTAQTVSRVNLAPDGDEADGPSYLRDLSSDGKQVLFMSLAQNLGTATPFAGLFIRDRDSATTELVSRTSAGVPLGGNLHTAALSGDGRRIAFTTDGGNAGYGWGTKLVLFQRDAGRLELLMPIRDYRYIVGEPWLSSDGERLLIGSNDDQLSNDDTNGYFSDVFLLDRIGDTLFTDGFETP